MHIQRSLSASGASLSSTRRSRILAIVGQLAGNEGRIQVLRRRADRTGVDLVVAELAKFNFRTRDRTVLYSFGLTEAELQPEIQGVIVLGKRGFQQEFDWASFCLSASGIPVHGSALRIAPLSTKVGDALCFAYSGVAHPETAFARREFVLDVGRSLLDRYGGLVVKASGLGGRGEGVSLVASRSELESCVQSLPQIIHFVLQQPLQRYREYRAWVVGGSVVAWVEREIPEGVFHGNARYGARGVEVGPPDLKVARQAVHVAEVMGVDVVAFDLLLTQDGSWYFLEGNVGANFAVLPMADLVADALLAQALAPLGETRRSSAFVFTAGSGD